ncbi:hypothetical protein [Streptomyces sp. CBMA29]|nr:hypothetical protein [Streptomyces sp. CBMA29]
MLPPCDFPSERTLKEAELLTGHPSWAEPPAVRGRVRVLDGPAYVNRP